ncbi:MAG: hypothetical protein ABI954_09360 [Pyrinomonadaceae bacterium]
MSFFTPKFLWQKFSPLNRALLWIALITWLYILYINGIGNNPPGFYLDESAIAYNAYKIYQTGRGEFGDFFPLFFPFFPLPPPYYFLAYGNPVYIYLHALLYFVFPPSILLSRLFSATAGFFAALLLGTLGWRISLQLRIGMIVALTALTTPCLFELSRLVFEAALYPLALVLFLSALYNAHRKERWSLLDIIMLAITLCLLTYTYSIGRIMAPLFAIGLLFFAGNFKRLKDIIKVWIGYGLTLIPLLMLILNHPEVITQRFDALSYIRPGKSFWEISAQFITNYAQAISLRCLLFSGDLNLRHHIPEMGLIYAATFVLALMGIFIVLIYHFKNPWWRFILYGMVVSVVPSALTVDPIHMLRLIALPIFLIVLTVPGLMWLLNNVQNELVESKLLSFAFSASIFRLSFVTSILALLRKSFASRLVRRSTFVSLLILTMLQIVFFQIYFRQIGLSRGPWFDEAYPRVLAAALASPNRPIYLVDGYWGQAYIHAYWYATIEGIDLSNFVHIPYEQRPPADSIVISTEENCTNCEMILKEDKFLLYRSR